MSLKCGRKPESAKETHANTQHVNLGLELGKCVGFMDSEGIFPHLHCKERLESKTKFIMTETLLLEYFHAGPTALQKLYRTTFGLVVQ